MGNAKSSGLFLQKFPQFTEQWTRNQARTAGFIAYTQAAKHNRTYGASIENIALPSLKRINSLGFFTLDSQLGVVGERAYCEGFIPTVLLDPFMKNTKECNENLNVVVYPNDDDPVDVTLTKHIVDGVEEGLTFVPIYDQKQVRDHIVRDVLNAGERGTTASYYLGPPVGRIEIDRDSWRLIMVYDSQWEHNGVDKTGLFTCIEEAMDRALKSQTAGRRRRSNAKSRSQRASRSSRRRTSRA